MFPGREAGSTKLAERTVAGLLILEGSVGHFKFKEFGPFFNACDNDTIKHIPLSPAFKATRADIKLIDRKPAGSVNMFAQFVIPYDFSRCTAPYLWVVHLAAQNLVSELRLIASDEYWLTASEIINNVRSLPEGGKFDYLIARRLTLSQYDKVEKIAIEVNLYRSILSKNSLAKIVACLQEELNEDILSHVSKCISEPANIEALLLWTNCLSAHEAAKRLFIPTIYNELGPLRPPLYHSTIYFDFSGLHHKCEANDRWDAFSNTHLNKSIPVLDRNDLRSLLRATPITRQTCLPQYRAGVALQAPGGTFMSYSNGFTNYCLIDLALRTFGDCLLVRSHPGQAEVYPNLPVTYDYSETPEEFLNQCEAVVTINSGIAFEALLLGKPTYILGGSSISAGAWDLIDQSPKLDADAQTRWLNWYAFGYLVPFPLLFDPYYYRWRLSRPSEDEIYMRNLNWWKIHGGPAT